MNIPFYSDIYAFPGPWRHTCHPHRPHFKRSQVVETSKEVAISDATGSLRYTVQLVSSPLEDGLGFQVRVVHHYPNGTDEDVELVKTVPEDGTYTRDYKKIEDAFNTCVQRYNSLVKAETQDFNTIDIYKDKIGYKKTRPDCCMFCEWSRMPTPLDMWHKCPGYPHLECHNPDNEFKFTYMVDDCPGFPNKNHHRYCPDSWHKLPWMEEDPFKRKPLRGDEVLNRIFPHVDMFGVCNSFKRRDSKMPPH